MKKEDFYSLLNKEGINLDESKKENLSKYLIMLQEKNKVMNLTSITEEEEVYEKHFYDSLIFTFGLDLNNKTLIDVGTGAGFPGLVIAIIYPTCQVTLLDPLTKRCNFLNEVIANLKLTNVKVVNERSEDFAFKNKEKYDFAVARAVSRLNILLEIMAQLVKVDGLIVALKGKIALEEVEEAKNAIKELGFEMKEIQKSKLPTEDSLRYNLFLRKVNHTPLKYPRNYGQIKKRPL